MQERYELQQGEGCANILKAVPIVLSTSTNNKDDDIDLRLYVFFSLGRRQHSRVTVRCHTSPDTKQP